MPVSDALKVTFYSTQQKLQRGLSDDEAKSLIKDFDRSLWLLDIGEAKTGLIFDVMHWGNKRGFLYALFYRLNRLCDAVSDQETNLLFYAAKYGNKELFEYLCAQNPRLYEATNNNNQTIFHFLCMSPPEHDMSEACQAYLNKHPIPGSDNKREGLPIHHAAHSGNVAVLEVIKNQFSDEQWSGCVNDRTDDEWGNTPLMMACSNGHPQAVVWLLQNGATCVADDTQDLLRNKKGWSALDHAASSGNVAVLEVIKNQFSDEQWSGCVNDRTDDEWGNTPLMMACSNGHPQAVVWLLQNGATCVADDTQDLLRNKKGWSALDHAVESGDVAVLEVLRGQLSDEQWRQCVNQAIDSDRGNTLLMLACSNGHPQAVTWLLDNGVTLVAEGSADLPRNKKGWSVIDHAAESGNVAVLEVLRGQLSDEQWRQCVNQAIDSDRGNTLLMLACANGHPQAVTWLLDNGVTLVAEGSADLPRNKKGWSVIDHAASSGNVAVLEVLRGQLSDEQWRQCVNQAIDSDRGNTPLMLACANGHPQAVTWLLDNGVTLVAEGSADLPRNKTGWSALDHAASSGDVAVLALLQKKSQDVGQWLNHVNQPQQDEWGNTPLMLACSNGHPKAVTWLLDNGVTLVAEGSADLPRNKTGWSALDHAASSGDVAVLALLQKKSQDVGQWLNHVNQPQQDEWGNAPLMLACSNGHPKAVTWLLDNGATLVVVNTNHCQRNKVGWSALDHAAKSGNVGVLRVLKAHLPNDIQGRDLNASFMKALKFGGAAKGKDKSPYCKSIHFLLQEGATSICGQPGARLLRKNYSGSALFHAVKIGDLQIVEIIMSHVDAAGITDWNGCVRSNLSPFAVACCLGLTNIVQYFLNREGTKLSPITDDALVASACAQSSDLFDTLKEDGSFPFFCPDVVPPADRLVGDARLVRDLEGPLDGDDHKSYVNRFLSLPKMAQQKRLLGILKYSNEKILFRVHLGGDDIAVQLVQYGAFLDLFQTSLIDLQRQHVTEQVYRTKIEDLLKDLAEDLDENTKQCFVDKLVEQYNAQERSFSDLLCFTVRCMLTCSPTAGSQLSTHTRVRIYLQQHKLFSNLNQVHYQWIDSIKRDVTTSLSSESNVDALIKTIHPQGEGLCALVSFCRYFLPFILDFPPRENVSESGCEQLEMFQQKLYQLKLDLEMLIDHIGLCPDYYRAAVVGTIHEIASVLCREECAEEADEQMLPDETLGELDAHGLEWLMNQLQAYGDNLSEITQTIIRPSQASQAHFDTVKAGTEDKGATIPAEHPNGKRKRSSDAVGDGAEDLLPPVAKKPRWSESTVFRP